jgi:molybdopterin-synthase adenylyltransferase
VTGTAPRYARHVALPQFGAAGQAQLGAKSALVVGLGGLGSVTALYLAGAGVGQLVINDFDRVDETNLPRQVLFAATDVGEYKTHATAARLAAMNPGIRVSVLNRRLDTGELADAVSGCDVTVDATDNFATRLAINTACIGARKPLISGAAIRFEGQVATLPTPGVGGPCYRCLYADDDENLGNCAGQGIFAPVAGTVGAMMAGEALKLLLGLPSGLRDCLWLHDGLAVTNRLIRIQRRPDCPACGA